MPRNDDPYAGLTRDQLVDAGLTRDQLVDAGLLEGPHYRDFPPPDDCHPEDLEEEWLP